MDAFLKNISPLNQVASRARTFWDNEDGATSIEYSLIVGLIFLAIVGAVRSYSESTSDMYGEIEAALAE